ncbi:butyrophilin-like protein 2 isoform X2 [Salarias fasciatus]|uniref:Butyrophilin-like protein 2 n=1 Tax=Salarias fasciatus TaxID=181472 RepID=A0A672GG95_SALFA|nr:butyrophilin-like protein 2 isoform X2 [Salarias fasciatus]XP_029950937.1 butyrophilin-like protein 2 isoform X2 [Salarias fasciatus]
MASIGTCLFLFAVICVAAGNSKNDFVTVNCDAEIVGMVGHQSLLNCSLQLSAEVSDVNIRVVRWSKKGRKLPVMVYYEGKWNKAPGYDVAESSWNEKSSNLSMLITSTSVTDDGEYTCTVVTDSGRSEGSTSLRVRAKYSPPEVHSIPEKIIENQDSSLICETGGGYPEGKIRWLDVHDKDWTASSEMEAKQTDDGLFQLSSKLLLKRGSTFDEYKCVVYNARGSKEMEVTFKPSPEKQKGPETHNPTHYVAPLVVIGSLAVGLLLLLVLCRRRQTQHNPQEVPTQDYDVEKGDDQKTDQ